jgi:hypothetical protein
MFEERKKRSVIGEIACKGANGRREGIRARKQGECAFSFHSLPHKVGSERRVGGVELVRWVSMCAAGWAFAVQLFRFSSLVAKGHDGEDKAAVVSSSMGVECQKWNMF